EHERTYGHRAGPEEPVELVNIQVVGQGIPDQPRMPETLRPSMAAVTLSPTSRQAYFGPQVGWMATPVLHRSDFDRARPGPCIIEEYDATCIIPPNAQAQLDTYGNIVIELS
ncbi:MAG: hydantoinase/oxoprolinase family protein, partial [Candidatus Tectomicrobia bacterium]